MALKKMRVSFDLDIEVFAQILAKANSGIKIDMFGEEVRAPREKMKALPKSDGASVRNHLLAVMKAEPEREYTTMELKGLVIANGASLGQNGIHGAVHDLFTHRMLKRTKPGVYKLTALGAEHAA
jgi:hypothetical protein